MRDQRLNYVRVGGFVLAMLVALVAALVVLAKPPFGANTYYVVYDNVSGLKPGTRVLFEGFPIGQISAIEPIQRDNRVRFRVHLKVTEDEVAIPKDSTAVVAASGILSAVVVDIRTGQAQIALADGEELRAGPSGNLFAVMADVARQVSDLSQNSLKPLLAIVQRQMETLGGALEKQAPELLANLTAVAADLAQKTPAITQNVQTVTGNLTTVVNDRTAQKMERTIDAVHDLATGLQGTRDQINKLLTTVNAVVDQNKGNVSESLRDLRYSLEAVSRNIDSITYNLEGTSRNMNEFSRELRQNPGVLLRSGKPEDDTPRR